MRRRWTAPAGCPCRSAPAATARCPTRDARRRHAYGRQASRAAARLCEPRSRCERDRRRRLQTSSQCVRASRIPPPAWRGRDRRAVAGRLRKHVHGGGDGGEVFMIWIDRLQCAAIRAAKLAIDERRVEPPRLEILVLEDPLEERNRGLDATHFVFGQRSP